MSFEAHLRPWVDPEEPLEGYHGNGEWIFDPDEGSLADYLEAQARD